MKANEGSAVDLKVNGVRKEKERLTAHKEEAEGSQVPIIIS